jgi:hypothetical protein
MTGAAIAVPQNTVIKNPCTVCSNVDCLCRAFSSNLNYCMINALYEYRKKISNSGMRLNEGEEITFEKLMRKVDYIRTKDDERRKLKEKNNQTEFKL